ncbi:MAG: hypothetical protein ACLSA6_14040 [Holdemania massiliensis]
MFIIQMISPSSVTLTSAGEEFLIGNMKIINQDDKLNSPQDTPSLKTQIRIRVRGNTSRWFDTTLRLKRFIIMARIKGFHHGDGSQS